MHECHVSTRPSITFLKHVFLIQVIGCEIIFPLKAYPITIVTTSSGSSLPIHVLFHRHFCCNMIEKMSDGMSLSCISLPSRATQSRTSLDAIPTHLSPVTSHTSPAEFLPTPPRPATPSHARRMVFECLPQRWGHYNHLATRWGE